MIDVRRQDDGNAQIYVDAEDDLGTHFGVNLDDHTGLKLWLDLALFYRTKGHNMEALLTRAPMGGAGFFTRVKQGLLHVIGG